MGTALPDLSSYADPPWRLINDYLLEVGAERDLAGFYRRVVESIGRLIPFDVSGVFGLLDTSGTIIAREALGESRRWLDAFNQYYRKTMPPLEAPGLKSKLVDWYDLRRTEFVTDFLQPQRIRYSGLVLDLGRSCGMTGNFSLHRSNGSPPFTDGELAVLELIQPHLSNHYTVLSNLAALDPRVPDADVLQEAYPCLTRRKGGDRGPALPEIQYCGDRCGPPRQPADSPQTY